MKVVAYAKAVPLPLLAKLPPLRFVEAYFDVPPRSLRADVYASWFCEEPVPGWRAYAGATRIINLRRDVAVIFGDVKKKTRYEVNRAETKDDIETTASIAPADEELSSFVSYYNAFARSKDVPPIRAQVVRALRDAGMLALTTARGEDGSMLAAHAYVVAGGRARLTHSASLFRLEAGAGDRARLGRANRLLHWHDLVHFRESGFEIYDFGGWYQGDKNESLLQINSFKGEFGGDVVSEWSSFASGSFLGALYVGLRHLKLRASS